MLICEKYPLGTDRLQASRDPAASSDNGGDEERAAAAAGSTVDRARGSVVGAYDSSLAGGGGGGGPNHVSGDRLDSGAGGGGGYGGLQWNGLARDSKSKLQRTISTIQYTHIIYYYRQHSST